MGLIKAAFGSLGGVMAEQWKEYFYCEAMEKDVLVVKGMKRAGGNSSNTHVQDNIISNGSTIAVADGQCMIIVDQGKVVDICAEPGEYTYDMSTEPSLFSGSLSETIPQIFSNIGKRFTYGGEPPKDQRVYYVNTKELLGNKYGTANPVPFRIVDKNIGLDMDVSVKCFGEYSYRITNPILFYTNVCGNVPDVYFRDEIDSQLKSELLTALQPAFARISEMGIRYSALPGHTMELADAINKVLSAKWRDTRGIEIASIGVSSIKASDEDEAMIKELQRNATFRDPTMAAAHLVGAQAASMQAAAKNEGGMGAMGAFMGMNMAGNAGGMNPQSLFAMGQAQQQAQQQTQPAAQPQPAADSWKCACGNTVSGKFCPECGAKKPEASASDSVGWLCSCGATNKGKFCFECGAKKPAGVPQYKCDKCGWEPADPTNPPKFCPECGDPFDDGDIQGGN
ncbi:MAG: SPFH domain-containing protein [Lachnospiraceae bacterium]|nr:SPFH domain-containing protein [Lachnospiraceae bacterium]